MDSGKVISFIKLTLKMIILTFLLFICYLIASTAVGLTNTQPAEPMSAIIALLIVCTFQSAVISYLIIHSRWTSWRLIVTIFLVFYGITTFQSQIEAVVFLHYLVNIIPEEIIPKLFIQGAITAALFSPSAVLIHGKSKMLAETKTPVLEKLVWKLTLIAIIYVVIYFSFGKFVFIPLAGVAFREYYGALKLPVWIILFEMMRGIIWAALALLVILMMKGNRWETGLAVSLSFSVLMGFLLLLPNPYMPDTIRIAHFVEVFSSNFLFGWIVVWLLEH